MFNVKIMKNQMPLLIGQIHGDFKVTAYNFGQVYASDSLSWDGSILLNC